MFYKKITPVFRITLVLIVALSTFFCSKNHPTQIENGNADVVKSVTVEPGKEAHISFEEQFSINFPSDAVEAKVSVQAKEMDIQTNSTLYANASTLSPIYILTPHGQALKNPARIEFDISQIQIPDGYSTDDLEIYSYDGENFESENAVIEGDKLIAYTSHFSMKFVRMKPGTSLFGGCDIADTKLYVYKQNGYLCLENIFGALDINWIYSVFKLVETPINLQISYQVSLYESPTIGFDKLVWAKQSCRVEWGNMGTVYEPIWSLGKIGVDGTIIPGNIGYDNFPSNCFKWQKGTTGSTDGSYGDEYILNYDGNKNLVGSV